MVFNLCKKMVVIMAFYLPSWQFDDGDDSLIYFSTTEVGTSQNDRIVADLESFSIRHPVYNVERNQYN